MSIKRVEGTKKDHRVFLYTLSTCGWCKKTKEMLIEANIEYDYLDVDQLKTEERKTAFDDLKRRNAPLGFPIIIIDDTKLISGYDPLRIKEALGLQ